MRRMKLTARIFCFAAAISCAGCRPQTLPASSPITAAPPAVSSAKTGTQSGLWFAAVQRGDTAAVSALLDSGIPIETRHPSDGRTALMLAAVQNHAPLVKKLLERGAKKEAKDDDGVTPLMWAAFAGSKESAQSLMQAGAKADVKDNFGKTASDWGKDHPNITAILKNAAKK